MKTSALNTIATRLIIIVASLILGINFTSCSSTDAELASPDGTSEQVSAATVRFTYTIPQELLDYAQITVCYNNNEGTDAKWQPMLDNTYTVTYNLAKFPVTAPVVLVYDRTNRPAGGYMVDWTLKMDVEVTMVVGGRTEIKTHSKEFNLRGDLGQALESLMKNPLDRTYAVKLAKSGNIQFVN